ncbi:MAG: glycosyltransferase family 87 protein [Gemmataceae bacterium]
MECAGENTPSPWMVAREGSGPALFVRGVVLVWVVLLAAVCIRPLFQPGRSDLTLLWVSSAQLWSQGQSPYNTVDEFVNFRYGPPLAALFLPLSWVPTGVAIVGWRLLSAAVLLGGLAVWMREAAPRSMDRKTTAWVFLLLAPLALGSLNNGQANALLAGLFLWTLIGVNRRAWNLAALCLALAIWLKVYPVALALLLVLVHPVQLGLRVPFFVVLLGLLPYLTQGPDYVTEMYVTWWNVIRQGDVSRRFLPLENAYRDLLLLIRLWKVNISLGQYTLLQAVGALACAVLCLHGLVRRLPTRVQYLRIYTCVLVWIMLLGPATESNTYVLMAPLLCWWAVQVHEAGPAASRYLLGNALFLLYLCVVTVAGPSGRTVFLAAGLQPMAALLFACAYALAENRLYAMEASKSASVTIPANKAA